MQMYFIALVAPPGINEKVKKYKVYMKDKHQCEVALRSPAHITLVPPFWFQEENETKLIESINACCNKFIPVEIEMTGFSNFKPRVIFLDIRPNSLLENIRDVMIAELSKRAADVKKDDRPFHPHITIATRDLHKKAFGEAWEYFETKKFSASWTAESISLLKHNKKNWDVYYTSQLNK